MRSLRSSQNAVHSVSGTAPVTWFRKRMIRDLVSCELPVRAVSIDRRCRSLSMFFSSRMTISMRMRRRMYTTACRTTASLPLRASEVPARTQCARRRPMWRRFTPFWWSVSHRRSPLQSAPVMSGMSAPGWSSDPSCSFTVWDCCCLVLFGDAACTRWRTCPVRKSEASSERSSGSLVMPKTLVSLLRRRSELVDWLLGIATGRNPSNVELARPWLGVWDGVASTRSETHILAKRGITRRNSSLEATCTSSLCLSPSVVALVAAENASELSGGARRYALMSARRDCDIAMLFEAAASNSFSRTRCPRFLTNSGRSMR
mmetsp:Transcript_13839/g.51659  ORF Transcript_13839/g.51659 Transcript_13839/m.51659 type:complete len:317 (+) Transcript_13839:1665-2615(+)